VPDEQIAEAAQLAAQAIEIGRDEADAPWMGAHVPSFFARAHGAAMNAADRAITLNTNSACAWMAKGWVSCRVIGQSRLSRRLNAQGG